jgi:hypothetical protein
MMNALKFSAIALFGCALVVLWSWGMMDITAAHPTRIETMSGAGKTCTRMVEERWYGTQVVSYWDCRADSGSAPPLTAQ